MICSNVAVFKALFPKTKIKVQEEPSGTDDILNVPVVIKYDASVLLNVLEPMAQQLDTYFTDVVKQVRIVSEIDQKIGVVGEQLKRWPEDVSVQAAALRNDLGGLDALGKPEDKAQFYFELRTRTDALIKLAHDLEIFVQVHGQWVVVGNDPARECEHNVRPLSQYQAEVLANVAVWLGLRGASGCDSACDESEVLCGFRWSQAHAAMRFNFLNSGYGPAFVIVSQKRKWQGVSCPPTLRARVFSAFRTLTQKT